MADRRKKPKDVAYGLDVGNGAIKLVEVKRDGENRFRLSKHIVKPTPPNTVNNGVVIDRKNFLATLKAITREFGLGKQSVSTVLTGQNLVVRLLEVPRMPPYEFESSLKLQAGVYLGLPADNLTYDFQILKDLPDGKMQVFLVGSPRQPVVDFAATLKKAGVTATRVDIEPLAAYRSLEASEQVPQVVPSQTTVVIDLGAGTSNLSIFQEGVLQMVRVLSVAGNDFTRAIMDAEQIEFSEAEELKRKYGVRPDTPIYSAISPVLDRLTRQIAMSLEYYQVENRMTNVKHVSLVGGSSKLIGLLELVTARLEEVYSRIGLSVPKVELGNPCAGMACSLSAGDAGDLGPVLSVAIGLALGEVVAG